MDGKYLATNALGVTAEETAINQSTGVPDASKIIRTNATGLIDASFLPPSFGPELQILPTSENLAAGDLVNIWNDTGTAKARKADASAPNAGKIAMGFVLASTTAPANATVYFESMNNQLSGMTPGARQFLSGTTPGGVTETPVTTSGYLLQEVGFAVSATSLSFERGEGVIRA